MSYHFTKTTDAPFEYRVAKVTEELKKKRVGILTEIDLKETLN
jgi:uncharacterized protein (DUF302 family)